MAISRDKKQTLVAELTELLKDALNHPELAGYGVRGGKSARERQEILRLGENAINKAIKSAGK